MVTPPAPRTPRQRIANGLLKKNPSQCISSANCLLQQPHNASHLQIVCLNPQTKTKTKKTKENRLIRGPQTKTKKNKTKKNKENRLIRDPQTKTLRYESIFFGFFGFVFFGFGLGASDESIFFGFFGFVFFGFGLGASDESIFFVFKLSASTPRPKPKPKRTQPKKTKKIDPSETPKLKHFVMSRFSLVFLVLFFLVWVLVWGLRQTI